MYVYKIQDLNIYWHFIVIHYRYVLKYLTFCPQIERENKNGEKCGMVSSCLLELLYHCILDYENKDYIYINEPFTRFI
jgi:hypothetical protein